MNTLESIKAINDEIILHRRHLHANPELSFKEYETSEYIRSVLNDLGIENETIGQTGVVGLIGMGEKCIALRADIDALPIQEETGLPFCSKNVGVMHACGHDMHTAMLLGAAKILKENEDKLNGIVKLIFQPGEEKVPGGASVLIKEGILENPKPEAVFGQHIYPDASVGTISVVPGFIMAAPDEIYWTIRGKGGHAAQPHLNSDVMISASQLVIYLQSLITKFKNPVSPGLLSVTAIHGGSAPNIFPDEVKLMGTLRSFDSNWRKQMHNMIVEKSSEICKLYGTECEVKIECGYPAVFNNEKTTAFIQSTAKDIFGEKAVLEFEPKMWGEDFGFYAKEIPSTFWFLGVRPGNEKVMPGLHNSKMSPDEEAMVYGTAMSVEAGMRFLK
ncbi:MAG: M20 family metallopeptidase [bacterium]